ncbi:MAG: glycosyltransferase family 4 protein [Terriglobales bacterium]
MKEGLKSTRILYVTEILPMVGAFGGQLRCLNVLRALQQIGRVEILYIGDKDLGSTLTPNTGIGVAGVFEVQERPKRGFIGKLKWMFDPTTDYPHGYGVRPDALPKLLGILGEFDLIWFSRLRTSEMFPNTSWPCSVVDVDDLPSRYERTVLQLGGSPLRRLSALRCAFSWRRRERLLGKRFTVLTVCSEEDRQYLRRVGAKLPVHVIPNGFDKPPTEPKRSPSTPPRIGFIGLVDFFPNRHGLNWFVTKCWPRVKSRVPDARLRLVGQDSEGFLNSFGPDIDKLGWLADPAEEMKTWAAMVVPIRVGAGTRVKIAHAFSQKCPIISTTLGAYGYEAEDGREMYLADVPETFATACIRAIQEPDSASEMAERGWRRFLERWTWEAIRPQVWAAAEDCLHRSGTSGKSQDEYFQQRAIPSTKQPKPLLLDPED